MTFQRVTCKARIILTFHTNEEADLDADTIKGSILDVEQRLNSIGFFDVKNFPGGKVAMRVHIDGPQEIN